MHEAPGSLLGRPLPAIGSLPRIKTKQIEREPLYNVLAEQQFASYGYVDTDYWSAPKEYIRWMPPSEGEMARRVEYDMDEQDHIWLNLVNDSRIKQHVDAIPEEVFEIIMDKLEKEWFDLTSRIPKPNVNLSPEDQLCAICDNGECENANAIVFCDGCNLAVHQDCYGVPYIPEGQWLCRKCTVSPDKPVSCALCPVEAGAFKQTTQGTWAHLLCAIFVPEVGVSNTVYMEPIDGIEYIPKGRWDLRCYLCRQKHGAPIQCATKSCYSAFHVTCARQYGLTLDIRSPSDGTDHKAFCHRHSPTLNQEEDTPDSQSKAPIPFPKRVRTAKTSQAYTRSFVSAGPPVVPHMIYSKVVSYIKDLRFKQRDKFVAQVCRYWSLKRESRRGAPLLKRLHLEPWTQAAIARETSEFEKTHKIKLVNLLRADLEKVRLMTEMTREREHTRLEQAINIQDILDAILFPLRKPLKQALNAFRELDTQHFFGKLVSKELIPHYYTTIKHPMAWDVMEAKIDRYEYPDSAAFESDVRLVLNNATKFNGASTIWHIEAKRILKLVPSIMDSIRQLDTPLHQQHMKELPQLLTTELVEELMSLDYVPPPPPAAPSSPLTELSEEAPVLETPNAPATHPLAEVDMDSVKAAPDTSLGVLVAPDEDDLAATSTSKSGNDSTRKTVSKRGRRRKASSNRAKARARVRPTPTQVDSTLHGDVVSLEPVKENVGNESSELSELSDSDGQDSAVENHATSPVPVSVPVQSPSAQDATPTRQSPQRSRTQPLLAAFSPLKLTRSLKRREDVILHASDEPEPVEARVTSSEPSEPPRSNKRKRQAAEKTTTVQQAADSRQSVKRSRSRTSATPGVVMDAETKVEPLASQEAQSQEQSQGQPPKRQDNRKRGRSSQSLQSFRKRKRARVQEPIEALTTESVHQTVDQADDAVSDSEVAHHAQMTLDDAPVTEEDRFGILAKLEELKTMQPAAVEKMVNQIKFKYKLKEEEMDEADGFLVWVNEGGKPWPAEVDVVPAEDEGAQITALRESLSKKRVIVLWFDASTGNGRSRSAVHKASLFSLGDDLEFDALMLKRAMRHQKRGYNVLEDYLDARGGQELPEEAAAREAQESQSRSQSLQM